MDELAKILSKMLVGDMGLFLVYSTQPVPPTPPPAPPLPPVPPPPITPPPGTYWAKRKPEIERLNYYTTPSAPIPFASVATRWAMRVLERTDGPYDRLLVYNTPKLVIWVNPYDVVALTPDEIAEVELNPQVRL
jgi:hypothetical protein